MFELNFVTPEKKIVVGRELEQVWVPGFRGELNILPGHSPLTSTLVPGVLRYKLKGEDEKQCAISWGYLQVTPHGVSVMAESSLTKDEVHTSAAVDEVKLVEKRLLEDTLTDAEWKKLERTRLFAQAKLDLQ